MVNTMNNNIKTKIMIRIIAKTNVNADGEEMGMI